MIKVFLGSWALLLGMLFLMLGNGIQGTLLGIRGEIEGFSTFEMSIIMSAYFGGFMGGSRLAPGMIRRVGHVRVFAALASFISAVLILYPVLPNVAAWTIGRAIIGFCFSGVYVTAESWLNNSATNETRGQTLSLYMLVQTLGIVAAQGVMALGDPSNYVLFVVSSGLVSVSFAPILLSVSPTPAFETTKPLSLVALFNISPLGCAGMFLLGGLFSAQFGMSAVYGAGLGLSLNEISIFVSSFFIGALIVQYPLGWLSDRMDRRILILAVSIIGTLGAILGMVLGGQFLTLLAASFVIGGMTNPLYSLLLAYTNDFLDHDDMAAASGGMVFISGLGAIAGPVLTGAIMARIGPPGFFLFIGTLFATLAIYAVYRMTQRAAMPIGDTDSYAPIMMSSSPVAVEVAQEVAIENAIEEDEHATAT
ncbi:MAG: MFS transporter [Rhodobacterales bacterium]|nr:MFS transporter [Rhodobacterales bacterium]